MEDSPAEKGTVRVDVPCHPAGQSVTEPFPLIPFILIDTPFIAGYSNLPLEHAGWRREGSQQPAASLVPLQGEDQKLPGRASSGLLYLSAWSPGPLSHRFLIFTPMSFCQNAGRVPLAASTLLPPLPAVAQSKSSRAIPSNVSPHWLLTPKRYHSSCPQGLVPSYLCSLIPGSPPAASWLLPFPTLALCFSQELGLSSSLLCHSLYPGIPFSSGST